MSDKLSINKCGVCGNMVELIAVGGGQLVCCDQPMKHFVENTVDAAQEKHVPVVEKVDGGYKVTVGSVAHPMLQEHYIEWIELVTETRTYRKFLKPGEAPEAVFKTDCKNVYAREYCNLHGLWKS